MTDALMSLREYARHRGVSLKAVQKAIQDGRIDVVPTAKGNKINPEIADKQWAERTTPKPVGSDTTGPSYYKSKAEKEFYAAKIAELDYRQRMGELLEIRSVKKQLEQICTICRNQLLNLPDQLAPDLASMDDVHSISILLYKRINGSLAELSEALSKTAEMTTDDQEFESLTT